MLSSYMHSNIAEVDDMTSIERIQKMEGILDDSISIIDEIHALSEKVDENDKQLNELLGYYSSEVRFKDIEDDEKGLLPADLKRGVLSEDGIWNMLENYRSAAIEMMETALQILKNN